MLTVGVWSGWCAASFRGQGLRSVLINTSTHHYLGNTMGASAECFGTISGNITLPFQSFPVVHSQFYVCSWALPVFFLARTFRAIIHYMKPFLPARRAEQSPPTIGKVTAYIACTSDILPQPDLPCFLWAIRGEDLDLLVGMGKITALVLLAI